MYVKGEQNTAVFYIIKSKKINPKNTWNKNIKMRPTQSYSDNGLLIVLISLSGVFFVWNVKTLFTSAFSFLILLKVDRAGTFQTMSYSLLFASVLCHFWLFTFCVVILNGLNICYSIYSYYNLFLYTITKFSNLTWLISLRILSHSKTYCSYQKIYSISIYHIQNMSIT